MNEKTRYTDEELQEFKTVILQKLEKAQRDYELLKANVMNSDGNDTADTSPTFKVLEAVSYTHLDVYKRQLSAHAALRRLGILRPRPDAPRGSDTGNEERKSPLSRRR